jgi:hypothetical protein
VVQQLGSGNESMLPDGTWIGHESELIDTPTVTTFPFWRDPTHKEVMNHRRFKRGAELDHE